MTAPEAWQGQLAGASRPRLLAKGERGDTNLVGEHSVRRRHSAPSAGLRAWIAGAGPLYAAVRHEAYAAPTAWDEGGWTRDYVAGPTLAERGVMEWREAARAFVPAVEALHALHGEGLFHGHASTGNLIFQGEGLVLVDGGWTTRECHIAGRHLPGTLGYLAPEVLLGWVVEPRTDLYAMGSCLFRAMTGLLPWDAPTQEALFRMHLRGQVRRLRALVADAPPELEKLLVAMLAPTSSDRPRSAAEVAARLRALAGMPAEVHAVTAFPVRTSLVGRTNELRALRLAIVDTCLRAKDDAQGPLLLPGPNQQAGLAKRIEREERADSLEGISGERSVSATAIAVREPMRAVVVSQEARPEQGVHLRPMNGGVLLIAGEEGTGKTRLVEEAEQFALGEGVEFVVGRCPQRPARPFDPFAEILETLLVREPWQGPLEALPPLARYAEAGAPSTDFAALDAARRVNFDAVARFLVDRARRAPLAVCVEDLHYADGSVCAMFLHVVRALRLALHEGGDASGRPEVRTDLPRLFLLATYDPTAGAPRAEDLLRELRDIDAVQVIATLALARADQEDVLRGVLFDKLAEAAGERLRAWGLEKPLFVAETAQRGGTPLVPEPPAADFWEWRCGRVKKGDLERTAVMGRAVDASEVDVETCVRMGTARMALPRLTSGGPRFELSHDWTQRMAYGACGEARKAIHAECAGLVEGRAVPAIEREWHRLKGGVANGEDCRAAMQCLAMGDWELAETLLEALRQALGKGMPAERVKWLARAQVLSGYGFQATSLLRESGIDDAEAKGITAAIATRGEPGRMTIPGCPAYEDVSRSQAVLFEGKPDFAAELALRALRLAREGGPIEALPTVFGWMGRLYRLAAQFGAAIHCFRHAARMYRDLGNREEYGRTVALLAEAFDAVGAAVSAARAAAEARAAVPKPSGTMIDFEVSVAHVESAGDARVRAARLEVVAKRAPEGLARAVVDLRLVEARIAAGALEEATLTLAGLAGDALPPLMAPRATRLRAACAMAGGDVRALTGYASTDEMLRALDDTLAQQAEAAGNIEEAWTAHHALAGWIGKRWDTSAHRRRAAELVMAAYQALPEELKAGFLADPARKAIVEG